MPDDDRDGLLVGGCVLGRVRARRRVGALMTLTPRQTQLLTLLAHGHSRETAAEQMGITLETAKSHLRWAYVRLGARNRAHAVAIACRQGIIQ